MAEGRFDSSLSPAWLRLMCIFQNKTTTSWGLYADICEGEKSFVSRSLELFYVVVFAASMCSNDTLRVKREAVATENDLTMKRKL